MTEALQFRVFLDEDKVDNYIFSMFRKGIPCCDFFALDGDQIVPKNFVFLVDQDKLIGSKIVLLEDAFKSIHTGTWDTEGTSIPYIPLNVVRRVMLPKGETPTLWKLTTEWILGNNASKIEEINWKTSGIQVHILILSLQQALAYKINENLPFNHLFLAQALLLIKAITDNDSDLKKMYLYQFPHKYHNAARKGLFSE